jgi:hypothetical protein
LQEVSPEKSEPRESQGESDRRRREAFPEKEKKVKGMEERRKERKGRD